MKIFPLNQKSRDCIAFNGSFLALEGAVRSAKTTTANVAFYRRVLMSKDSVFMMSGNTMGSVVRNVIEGDFGFRAVTGWKAIPKTDRDNNKFLLLPAPIGDPREEIKIYYFGADNVGSYKKIQGLTIGGWYVDEYLLHDWEFIKVAEGRMIAATDPFTIATFNPDVPGHRFYKERIDAYIGKPWYKYEHFTLDDNPAITDERKALLKDRYTGVFYQRYILGMRVRAEGGCYPSFSDKNILHVLPDNIKFVVIGADVGGHSSASAFAATAYYVKDKELCACLVDEFHDNENKSAEAFIENFRVFAERVRKKFNCTECYFESGEQLLRQSASALDVVNVYNSVKLPIIDRIRFFDLMFSRGRLGIMDYCTHTIDAVRSAVYDPKAHREERLDDGTTDIDSLDAWEYSLTPNMEDF